MQGANLSTSSLQRFAGNRFPSESPSSRNGVATADVRMLYRRVKNTATGFRLGRPRKLSPMPESCIQLPIPGWAYPLGYRRMTDDVDRGSSDHGFVDFLPVE